DTAKNANSAPRNPGNASPKQVKEFNEAVNSSTTSNDASKGKHSSLHSQDTSNSHPIILASRPPINLGHPIGKQGAPLFQSKGAGSNAQVAGSNAGQQVATLAKPGKPLDVAQMEALNRRVQGFNVKGSPVDHQQLKDAQKHFQDATDALKAGDYKKAEGELRALGFPLPAAGGQMSKSAATSAILLG